jgi:hypothetical protein
MQSHVWAALARQLPPAVVEKMSIVTNAGSEITLQSVLRVENDFLIIRGRVSGTQETGRIFFIPFSQIDYLGCQPMQESEFETHFGGLKFDVVEAAPVAPVPKPPSAMIPPPAANGSAGNGAPQSYGSLPRPGASGSSPGTVLKSAVLERFRARNGPSGGGSPSPPPE